MYGHIKTMADAVKKGVEKAGGTVDVFQCVDP
jgi:multimeric flavodoxin WrbA